VKEKKICHRCTLIHTDKCQRRKEANETEYWLELLHEPKYLDPAAIASIHLDIVELLRLRTNINKKGEVQLRRTRRKLDLTF